MLTSDNPPAAADYLNAVSELKDGFTGVQSTILITQFSSPGRAVTSQQLRDALGYTSIGASNLAYGRLGKLLAGRLGFGVADSALHG
jgi:hypothetical protein